MRLNNDIKSTELAKELSTAGIQVMQIEFFGDNADLFSIWVPHIDEIKKIYEIIFEDNEVNYEDSLFIRVFHGHNTDDSWDYALSPIHTDWGQRMLKELNGGKTPSFSTTSIVDEEPFQFTAYVIIPESDYDEVLSRVKEHNK